MTTVRGILVPAEWSKDDTVTRVVLFTADESAFEFDIGEGTSELLEHLRKEVTVKGVLTLDSRDRKVMTVTSYEVVTEPSEP